jgi:hypothetical protein
VSFVRAFRLKITRIIGLVSVALSASACGTGAYVSQSGNCRVLLDDASDEYAQYLAGIRRVTGCQAAALTDCEASIKLEIVEFPSHVSRDVFEAPESANVKVPHVTLRTTSLVKYDLWVSQYFIGRGEGYELQYRDSAGKLLQPTMSEAEFTDCGRYVVLSAGNHLDIDIPVTGHYYSQLKGNVVQLTVAYSFRPWGTPVAPAGSWPVVGTAVSSTISITIDADTPE